MNRLKVARGAVTPSVHPVAPVASGVAAAKPGDEPASRSSSFGVDMAKRGLWSEALFRFEQARLLEPGSVASAQQPGGLLRGGGTVRGGPARPTARRCASTPENRVVKQNYSRFVEFYQGYRPKAGTTPTPAVLPVEPAPAPAPAAPGGRR